MTALHHHDTRRHPPEACGPMTAPTPTGRSRAVPYFRALTGHAPWPWQRRLYEALVAGAVPDALDIPTGFGKTAAVLLALLARIENPALARRVVYVVDRRAIVDQTVAAVRTWIERIGTLPALARAFDALGAYPAACPVGLGVLRGGCADDGAWRLDPARCAVLVGTVDMVGSRLLLSGYGDGRALRATHAGLLGHDALVLLDEAHLSVPFAALLRAVERLAGAGAPFRAMTLSATGPAGARVCGLSQADYRCPGVRRRLDAAKRPCFVEVATHAERNRRIVAAAAVHRTGAVAVFVERVADARRIARGLTARLGSGAGDRVAVLTGTLRGRERVALAQGAVWRRFAPEGARPSDVPPVWLVATAAAEVGVDLDADHAVMDLSTLASMVQRLGRVNRAGRGEADVTVVFTTREAQGPDPVAASSRARRAAARAATLAALRPLASFSPRALRALDAGTVGRCAPPAPRPAPLDAAVLEAFAATSAALPRPPVGVYLRGVSDAPEPADCYLAWRHDVAEVAALGAEVAAEVLAFFPPEPTELARVPVSFACTVVQCAIARQGGALPLVVAGSDGAVFAGAVTEAALPALGFATVLLPCAAGGLSPEGLPDAQASGPVEDVADTAARIRYVAPCPPASLPDWTEGAMTLRVPMDAETDAAEHQRCLVWAKRPTAAGAQTGEDDTGRHGATAQTLDAHSAAVAAAARRLGGALGLPARLVDALECAGRWHDVGKARAVWQRAAGAPADSPALAKSLRRQFRPAWLGGYRHECGSLADAERALGPDVAHRDLVLHLVAAHHGWSRPAFAGRRQLDPEATARANAACARRAARRFARLQAEHGPWRLAWLEALLKAADAHVSAHGAGAVR